MTEIFVEGVVYSSCFSRRVVACVALAGGLWAGSMAGSSACAAGYVPPGGADSVDRLMSGGNSNGYGLEALVAQEGAASVSSSSSSSGSHRTSDGRSVLDSLGGAPSSSSASAAARKALRAENRQLKGKVNSLNARLTALQAKLRDTQDVSAQTILQKSLSQAKSRADAAEEKVDTLTGQVKAAGEKLAAATAAVKQRDRELQALQTQVSAGKEDKGQLSGQLSALGTKVATLTAALRDAQGRLASKDATLKSTQVQLTDMQRVSQSNVRELTSVKTQLMDLKGKLAATENAKTRTEITLASVREQLKVTTRKVAGGQVVPLDTPARQQAYVVGQAMAASLRERLRDYDEAGVTLDRARVIAGMSDGLRDRLQMKRPAMDLAWQTFAATLQQHIDDQVKAGEALVTKLGAGRKPALKADGMQFFVMKKGQAVKDPDALRSLSLTEQLAPKGRVVSQVPRLTLSPDDDMPAVVRDALPLLGPGSEVEVFALARTVYGERPLPKGVAPYTVLHYLMKGLAAK